MTQIVTEGGGEKQVLTVAADPTGSLRVRLRTEAASSPSGSAPGRIVNECVLSGTMVAGLLAWITGVLPSLERQEPVEHRFTVPDGRGRYCRLQVTARMRCATVEEPGQGPRRDEYGGRLQLELLNTETGEVEGTASVPVADIHRFLRALRHSRGA